MKITTKDDIEAPIAFVYAQVSDFAALERRALRHGANVRRLDTLPQPGPGSAWDMTFPFRGKDRDFRVDVVTVETPTSLTVKAKSGGVDSVTLIELVALSRTQTRLNITVELLPTNLTARLLVQSLKLAKGSVTSRLQGRLTGFATEVQNRYQRKSKAS